MSQKKNMNSPTANIVSYVCNAISIALSLFCLFKILNLTRKITALSDFATSDVFSVRFQTMISNYFSEIKNTKFVLEPILPWLRTAFDTPPELPAEKSPIANIGGTFFIE
jgi:hypothetical protein